MGFLKKAFSFLGRPTYSRTLIMIVLVAAVSLTVVASQQQQTTKQRASDFPECNNIDNIPQCTSQPYTACSSDLKGNQCRIGQAIYKCQESQGGGGDIGD